MRKIFLVLIGLLLLSPICVTAHKVYHDSHVLVIGTCRTIVTTDNKWSDKFYQGDIETVGVVDIEKLFIWVFQNGTCVYHKFVLLDDVSFLLWYTSGMFFWRARFSGEYVSLPLLYINADVEDVYVHEW